MIGIYKITNTINGKFYIGQAIDIEERWKSHRRNSLNSKSKEYNYPLYRAIRKYGIENFSFEIVEECSIEELNEKEIYYIGEFNSYIHAENSQGYNMTLGGEGTRGHKASKETREKISIATKGESNPMYGKRGELSPLFGRKFSEEHRQKISKALSKRKLSKETIARISQSKKGRKLSEEHRQKISEKTKGENNPFYGKSHSEETKRKISENHADFKGGKSPRAKKVICEDREFDCVGDFCNFYNIKRSTATNWLNGTNKMPQAFADKGLRYKDKKGEDIGC